MYPLSLLDRSAELLYLMVKPTLCYEAIPGVRPLARWGFRPFVMTDSSTTRSVTRFGDFLADALTKGWIVVSIDAYDPVEIETAPTLLSQGSRDAWEQHVNKPQQSFAHNAGSFRSASASLSRTSSIYTNCKLST